MSHTECRACGRILWPGEDHAGRCITESLLAEMAAAVDHRGFAPSRFVGDLLRDGAWVQRNAGRAFWWVLRETGTHVCPTDESLTAVLDTIDDVRAVYLYDRQELTLESRPFGALAGVASA